MPEIQPAAGDLIQTQICLEGGGERIFLAKIKSKDPAGRYEIELSGDPPLRGTVDINLYEWVHGEKKWQRKEKPAVSKFGGPLPRQPSYQEISTQPPSKLP